MQTTFTPENFEKAYKPYRLKWGIAYLIFLCPMFIIILFVTIPKWQFSQWFISLMMDTGAIFDGRTIKHGVLVIGVHTAAIIAISVNAFGAFVVGINAVGVVAIGTNAVGIIAIGVNAVGIIAIGTNAVGVITITLGGYGYGIYVLSHTQRVRGKNLFTPHRQDPKAVAFFTRWLPRFAESPPIK
jgi:hypothetical protein